MDGFYAAFLAGGAGTSQLLFAIHGGTFVGVDSGGLSYDGQVVPTENGTVKCALVYVIPAGAQLITGAPPPDREVRVPLEFMLPKDFYNGQVVRVDTPLGPVNAKFKKLREW